MATTPAPPPELCGDAAARTAFADAFTAALAANGSYAALPGSFSFFNVTICEVLGTCFFQNANGNRELELGSRRGRGDSEEGAERARRCTDEGNETKTKDGSTWQL